MDGWGRLLLVGLMAGIGAASNSQAESATSASACQFEVVGGGKVATVIDARSFTLDDGREIRLAGIEVPLLPAGGEAGPRATAAISARSALESMLAGRRVELRQRGAATDRYGRALAHVYLVEDGPARPVAQEMLAKGYALVAAQVGDRACAFELLAREQAARHAKLGLWGEPYYAIMDGAGGAALLAERGRFTVVEGKVWSVRESGGTIYMNFGRRWSDALTVTVLKRHERGFTAVGLPPKTLENRRVRVRGWIDERNGPRIEATSPEQIEIAERD